MRVALNTLSIDLQCWPSKDELCIYLAKFYNSLLLGEPRESERRFYSITLVPEILPADKPFAIGVLSDGYGVSPQTAPALSQGLLLVGFDSEVIGVQIHSRKVLFRSELTFPFRSLMALRDSEWLIFHECGVQAINTTGGTLWAFSRDVVELAEIHGDTLHLQFMDSEPVSLNRLTGAEV